MPVHLLTRLARELLLFYQLELARAVRTQHGVIALGVHALEARIEVRPGQTGVGTKKRAIIREPRVTDGRRRLLQHRIAPVQREIGWKDRMEAAVRNELPAPRCPQEQLGNPRLEFDIHIQSLS